MKVTEDVPDDVYRQVKAKSALEGWSVREVATTLFQAWGKSPASEPAGKGARENGKRASADPAWFGSLRSYAKHAKGRHDMESIRRSIARGRAGEERP